MDNNEMVYTYIEIGKRLADPDLYGATIPMPIPLSLLGNVANLQVGPEETSKETDKETNKEIEETNKEINDRIINLLEVRPEMAVREIAEKLGLSASGVRYHINKMKKSGMLEHIGSTKKGKWIVHKVLL